MEEELTRQQHFDRLPADVKEKVMTNFNKEYGPIAPTLMKQKFHSASVAIISSFHFGKSPEGEEYWLNIVDKLDK